VLPGGRTLRTEVADRLAPYTNYPPDILSLKTNLAAIRDLFTHTASFTLQQQRSITNALSPFDPHRKIRFRSSTNLEDSEHFTGAGLYDSYSGCLMDDLDENAAGPCQCDPAEPEERGVFRALQKVYASFYNDDAFLERLRHRVNESQVAMGVLVHHSFPDEEELANGVATPTFTYTSFSTNVSGELVTQEGAVSVTNPDGSSVPEVVHVSRYNTYTSLSLEQRSSLVPLGDYVMDWQVDYKAFVDLFTTVAFGYRQYYPDKNGFSLDFEYKKDLNLGRVVKQVREVPRPGTTNLVTAFLIDEPAESEVQQRGSSVFANHRLKSVWNLRTANLRMTSSNLTQGIYTQGSLEYLEGGGIQTLAGPLSAWPSASVGPGGGLNFWTTGDGADQRFWRLETTLLTNVSGSQPPVFTQNDFSREVTVTYATPMPTISGADAPTNTTTETVSLQPRFPASTVGVLQQRSFVTNGVGVDISFYWPKPPEGVVAGYTAPLLRFVETRITGLVPDTIVLTNYYSQSYGAFHHNFYEEFVFEPRLEPGLSASTLAQLNASSIQLLYIYSTGSQPVVLYVLGLDQKFRRL